MTNLPSELFESLVSLFVEVMFITGPSSGPPLSPQPWVIFNVKAVASVFMGQRDVVNHRRSTQGCTAGPPSVLQSPRAPLPAHRQSGSHRFSRLFKDQLIIYIE